MLASLVAPRHARRVLGRGSSCMLSTVVNREWLCLQQPEGAPVLDRDIALQENPMPRISEDGEILVRNLEMSLDPYIRGTMNKLSYGRKRGYPRRMEAGCVSQVVESRHAHYPVGSLVNGQFGWCDYAVAKPDKLNQQTFTAVRQIPPHWQRTHALGILGMPGATAYLGLTEIINPKPGETVVVSSCTGAVGMVVGQMAKLLGAGKVVGFCSSSKLALAKELGCYDEVISYTRQDVETLKKQLRAATDGPASVNAYFDNSGGPCTEAVLMCLAHRARVAVCGQIAYYNLPDPLSARAYPATMAALMASAKIEGFMVPELPKSEPGNWDEAFEKLAAWLEAGDIHVREDVTDGLENAYAAFLTLFHDVPGVAWQVGVTPGGKGSNLGKKIVKISEPPLPLLELERS
jgi:NADPH-dependent curcumin reductase CurA